MVGREQIRSWKKLPLILNYDMHFFYRPIRTPCYLRLVICIYNEMLLQESSGCLVQKYSSTDSSKFLTLHTHIHQKKKKTIFTSFKYTLFDFLTQVTSQYWHLQISQRTLHDDLKEQKSIKEGRDWKDFYIRPHLPVSLSSLQHSAVSNAHFCGSI